MSKEKRRVPKLRFPGFTEDWEQRKLGDVAIITGGGTPSTNVPEYWNGDIDWYSPVEIGKNRYVSKSTRKITKLGLEKSSAKLLPIGTVLFTSRAGIGNTAILQAEGCTNQGFQSITPDSKELDTYFLYTMTPRLKRYGEVTGAGSTFVEVSGKQMEKMSLVLPSLEEQKQIGRFFRTIDDSITLHQRKLNNLKLKKKALLQKLFPKNGERYPELRFPGFTDAWEQRKLGEIFEYLQNNTLSRDSLNYKIPNIKNIHYGDILVKFNEILDGSNKDIPYINPDLDLSKFSKSLLRDGDVIFSDTAEDDTVGKAIELQNVNAPFILSGLHTIPCRPLIPFGKGYLGNFFNSNSYRLQIRPLVQGIKVSSISKSALKDTMIKYPKNLDEQEKIGSLFQSITKMITLHQRKLDHLQLQKKALLQQMFV